MLNNDLRNLFVYWYIKGLDHHDWNDGIKFFYFYLCLNILMANISNEDRDIEMINWVKSNNSLLSDAFTARLNFTSFIEKITLLQNLCPVMDSRQNSNRQANLRDVRNMGETLDVIYQIRCNYFHGNKPLVVDRNQRLIAASASILKDWLEEIISITSINISP